MIKLEIAIRKVVGKRSDKYKFQIREQYSRSIRYSLDGTFELKCNSTPQITPDTFYLRGSSLAHDNIWVDCLEAQLLPIFQQLYAYAQENNFSIKCDINPLGQEFIISISQPELGRKALRFSSIISMYQYATDLRHSEPSDFAATQTCGKCGLQSKGEIRFYQVSGMGNICKNCVDKLPKCDVCTSYTDKTIIKFDSLGKERNVCKKCTKQSSCSNCKFKELQVFMKYNCNIGDSGQTRHDMICQKCTENYSKCSSCSHVFPKEYAKCPCRTPTDFRGMILPYNADVTRMLPIDIDCELGLEIEVGVACKHRYKYEEVYNHTQKIISNDAITVFDRSIDEVDVDNHIPNTFRGFEIVTRPMSQRNMIKFINELTSKRHQDLRCWDVKTAGIHIHYNRSLLNRVEIGKLLKFINKPENMDLIIHIARRNNTRYARFRNKRIVDYRDTSRECHYDALNTNKPHTIEFRIFRGSLNRETILSYVQFVFSAIQFVRQTPTKKLVTEEYLSWISKTNKSSFRYLKDRLNTLGMDKQLEVGGEQ